MDSHSFRDHSRTINSNLVLEDEVYPIFERESIQSQSKKNEVTLEPIKQAYVWKSNHSTRTGIGDG